MSTDITSLLGGGTTETINGTSYPTPSVVDVTRQIIAINEDPTLNQQQKQDKIDALTGISYSYVQNNPQVNYLGTLYTSTAEDVNAVNTVLQNLYNQLANPTNNPLIVNNQSDIVNQPTVISASDTGMGAVSGSDPTGSLITSPLQNQQVQQSNSTMSNLGNIFSKYGIWLIVGIVLFLVLMPHKTYKKMEYSPKIMERMR